jgi:hypothetical protein
MSKLEALLWLTHKKKSRRKAHKIPIKMVVVAVETIRQWKNQEKDFANTGKEADAKTKEGVTKAKITSSVRSKELFVVPWC